MTSKQTQFNILYQPMYTIMLYILYYIRLGDGDQTEQTEPTDTHA